jgi:hypothetical protein
MMLFLSSIYSSQLRAMAVTGINKNKKRSFIGAHLPH